MLPHRPDRYIFPTVLAAGCILATAGWGQSYDASIADRPTQRDEISIGGKFKFGAATIDLNHMSLSDWPDRQSAMSDI